MQKDWDSVFHGWEPFVFAWSLGFFLVGGWKRRLKPAGCGLADIVRFRSWSLQAAVQSENYDLGMKISKEPDFWSQEKVLGQVNTLLRGKKCLVLPDCR